MLADMVEKYSGNSEAVEPFDDTERGLPWREVVSIAFEGGVRGSHCSVLARCSSRRC